MGENLISITDLEQQAVPRSPDHTRQLEHHMRSEEVEGPTFTVISGNVMTGLDVCFKPERMIIGHFGVLDLITVTGPTSYATIVASRLFLIAFDMPDPVSFHLISERSRIAQGLCETKTGLRRGNRRRKKRRGIHP
jgi:hypothetical protein